MGNSLAEKQDMSVKHLREVFNFKYRIPLHGIYLPLSMHVRVKIFEDLAVKESITVLPSPSAFSCDLLQHEKKSVFFPNRNFISAFMY